MLAGLVIQIITFTIFIIVAVHFDVVVAKSGRRGGRWRWLMNALYGACALILVISEIFTSHYSNVRYADRCSIILNKQNKKSSDGLYFYVCILGCAIL